MSGIPERGNKDLMTCLWESHGYIPAFMTLIQQMLIERNRSGLLDLQSLHSYLSDTELDWRSGSFQLSTTHEHYR
jgi:hypothetical protein